jgi:ferrous iron transport protein A
MVLDNSGFYKVFHMSNEVNLARMEEGRTGVISDIIGGGKFRLKLESMGIRPGSKITKISNLFYRGPVVLHVGGTEVAIGHRMARRILINPNPPERSL